MSEKLLGIEEAAEMLGRSENAVRRLVERRRIPYRKDGRRLLFLESELRAFIEDLPGLSLEDVRMLEHVKVENHTRSGEIEECLKTLR